MIDLETPPLAVELGPRDRELVMGYAIDRVSMEETVSRCRSFLTETRRPHLIVTVNAAILAQADRSEDLKAAIQSGDLVLADGVSIVWASKLLGGELKHRVTGIDLMEQLTRVASEERLRVYFLGARPEVVRKVVARVALKFPGVQVAGFSDGYRGTEDRDHLVEEIRESRADILFVAMPTPFKELWCASQLEELEVPIVLPVGGAFDVFAGLIPRAPLWMQNVGLEWFWRLLMEPRAKTSRYLVQNSLFVWIFLCHLCRRLLGDAIPLAVMEPGD